MEGEDKWQAVDVCFVNHPTIVLLPETVAVASYVLAVGQPMSEHGDSVRQAAIGMVH